MKIKRFFAPDMRQAMRQVRDTFGADAVILSNKLVEGGVELVAAKDYDESQVLGQVSTPAPSAAPRNPYAREPTAPLGSHPPPSTPRPSPAATPTLPGGRPAPGQVHSLMERLKERIQVPADTAAPLASSGPEPGADESVLAEMRREMQALRRLMESEFSELSWYGMGQRHPRKKELLRRLMALDLHPELCRILAEEAEAEQDPERAYRQALGNLVARLPAARTDLLEQGGALALIGPTGVGKTTTVAKLAARFCLRYGNRQLALITTDNYRIGAEEQLHTYGHILDVPVRSAADATTLNAALNLFADRRLVLIDTAGMSQRDLRLGEQIALLKGGNRPIHTLLALAATTQEASLEHAIEAFSVASPDACVVTKLDEACSLGGLLSTLSRHTLPMAFTTDGQKVPEDIHVGRPHTLVSRAVELSRRDRIEIGEDLLAMQLGSAREQAYA